VVAALKCKAQILPRATPAEARAAQHRDELSNWGRAMQAVGKIIDLDSFTTPSGRCMSRLVMTWSVMMESFGLDLVVTFCLVRGYLDTEWKTAKFLRSLVVLPC
jgi:hypothetical protein